MKLCAALDKKCFCERVAVVETSVFLWLLVLVDTSKISGIVPEPHIAVEMLKGL